ncbi:hypothetical protein TrLO_g14316 [Triparma laevis f. longispina]|uniref:Uncharacterized protein n=1 Tax=Triparma laevis f. longispina TaxID=1714387 RepID=A0A9W7CM21_9STRA|nr:hypothetical protein TrLO_g14316 [Triparma laevis f. longispina]
MTQLLLILLPLLCPATAADPLPPLWGGSQHWSSSVLFTDEADSPLPNKTWPMTYFYDETIKSELYQHGEGNGDMVCINVAHYPPGDPCNVLTAPDGHTYIVHLETNSCCRSPRHLGMLKSTWMINSNTTYNGTATINGELADQWTCMGSVNGENNYAATTTEDRKPVAFWEEKNNLTKRWDFVLDTYDVSQPDSSVFEIPDSCTKICSLRT